jgi:hypothetical protein
MRAERRIISEQREAILRVAPRGVEPEPPLKQMVCQGRSPVNEARVKGATRNNCKYKILRLLVLNRHRPPSTCLLVESAPDQC